MVTPEEGGSTVPHRDDPTVRHWALGDDPHATPRGAPRVADQAWTPEFGRAPDFGAGERELPLAMNSHACFLPNGTWKALTLWGRRLQSGYVGVAWRAANVSFTVTWSNPLWEATRV